MTLGDPDQEAADPAFTHQPPAVRVVFGAGSLDRLAEEMERLGAIRVLVLTTPDQRKLGERVARMLDGNAAGIYPAAMPGVPRDAVDAAQAEAQRLQADCCVAVGGGTAIGLAKALAVRGPPFAAVPTTYSGTEMTPAWRLTEGSSVRAGRDARALPRVVVYDPDLTLPPALSAGSGLSAIAHCVEALYAPDANPVTTMAACAGLRTLREALPLAVQSPDNSAARSRVLYGAYLGGLCLGSVTMGLHHRLCDVLETTCAVPYAALQAPLLPHVAALNRDFLANAAETLGEDAAGALWRLAEKLDAPMRLADVGVSGETLDRAAELATAELCPNPVPVTREIVRALLQAAFDGAPPDG